MCVWQVTAVYATLGQLARGVETQPSAESTVVVRRLAHFTGEYMAEVGLDMWLQNHGGLGAFLNDMVCLLLPRNLVTMTTIHLCRGQSQLETRLTFLLLTSDTFYSTTISAHDNNINNGDGDCDIIMR